MIAPPPQLPSMPPRTGTITFAEYVDPKTFQTRHEGKIFSRGWVHLVIRSNRPFGDTMVVVSYSLVDSNVWHILRSEVIDPNWDDWCTVIKLIAPGTCRIKATNGAGEVVAEDVVSIVPCLPDWLIADWRGVLPSTNQFGVLVPGRRYHLGFDHAARLAVELGRRKR